VIILAWLDRFPAFETVPPIAGMLSARVGNGRCPSSEHCTALAMASVFSFPSGDFASSKKRTFFDATETGVEGMDSS